MEELKKTVQTWDLTKIDSFVPLNKLSELAHDKRAQEVTVRGGIIFEKNNQRTAMSASRFRANYLV